MRAWTTSAVFIASGVVAGAICHASAAQEATGEWHGILNAPGVALRIGVTIKPKPQGGYEGTLLSPDQTPNPIPMDDVKLADSTLSFSIPAAQASYSGKWDVSRKAWVGEFRQSVAALPLELRSGSVLSEPTPAKPTDGPPLKPYLTPNLVRLPDGRRMNLVCMGEGSPTVILENGLGSGGWALTQYKIAKTTRICSYDRAGMGFSDEGKTPRDALAIAADLRALVLSAGLRGPYVLVGHSIGSYFVRLYADLHPKEVAGMVLIDPSIDDQLELLAVIAPKTAKESGDQVLGQMAKCGAAAESGKLKAGTEVYQTCVPQLPANIEPELRAAAITPYLKPAMYRTVKSEAASIERDSSENKAHKRSYGDIPLIVLTAGNPDAGPMTPSEIRAWAATWKTAHDEMAALSSRGRNDVVPGAGHYIQAQRPQVVIDAVEEVVREVRRRAGG